ncbi:MAG: PHP-associated domain-containing protein [Candidatus Heimdallarchaeaceae archaeon]|jgi:predicted metal-dependent phosphoesterase TrpH
MPDIQFDLHIHSHYSNDCKSDPADIIKKAELEGLKGIAITDHNNVKFHQIDIKSDKLLIIPGIEVSTTRGHVTGLGIKTLIQKKLSVEETIEKIVELGGLPVIPHPFDFTRKGIGKIIYNLKDVVIETQNASCPFQFFNEKAKKWVKQNKLPQTGGSDSHRIKDIGLAYTIFNNEVNSIDEALEAIRKKNTVSAGTHLSLAEKFIRAFQIHF